MSVRLCTLGDLLLDVIVRVDGPLAQGDDVVAETHAGAGGQAANVAAWAAALGARARFLGRRGDDVAGRLVEAELQARGVELVGPAGGRNGIVVSLVGADGDRSMASDRGVAPELAPDDVEESWLAGCDVLHVSGYSLLRSPIDEASLRAAELARAVGARVSVDLSSATTIRALGAARFRRLVASLEPDVVFGTEAELAEIGGVDNATVVEKRGADGIRVEGRAYPARAAEVVDATGAGDAIAAGFLVGGPELALEAAARCVARMGAMP